MRPRLVLLSLAVVLSLLGACGRGSREERCAHCGMRVDRASRWRAGLTTASGDELAFDTPKCLVRVLIGSRGRGAPPVGDSAASREAWVLDYYGGKRVPAADATFVSGSDVLGPMGPDLVPLADRASAERFAVDHGNRAILRLEEIDLRLLDEL